MVWEPPELDTDPASVIDKMVDRLAARQPGWEPYDGSLELALLESTGTESATLNAGAQEALSVLAAVGIGVTAFQLPVDAGATATIPAEITLTTAGAVIPAGFTATAVNTSGVEVAFELREAVTATGLGAIVTLHALEVGDYANQVFGGPMTVITSTTSVDTVEATAGSTGGADPETLEDYLDRLTDYLATLRPGGVHAADLATLARTVPGVDRAIGVDLYDPSDPAAASAQQHERTATVIAIDDTGNPVTSAALQATLEAAREVNFVIHLAQPKYTGVEIELGCTARAGADPATVQATVELAVARYVAPDTWGSTPEAPQSWTERSTLRVFDIAGAVLRVDGVDTIEYLTLNGAATDVVLPGPGALIRSPSAPGTPATAILVTVTQ